MATLAFIEIVVLSVRTTVHSVKQDDITVLLSNFLVNSNAEELTRTTWSSDTKMVISTLDSVINSNSGK